MTIKLMNNLFNNKRNFKNLNHIQINLQNFQTIKKNKNKNQKHFFLIIFLIYMNLLNYLKKNNLNKFKIRN